MREESLALVRQHWSEIEAVARELLEWGRLDGTEVELIADAASGNDEADVAKYRQAFGELLDAWRSNARPSKVIRGGTEENAGEETEV